MSEIVWTETATNDLNRHYDFIALSNADAAVRAGGRSGGHPVR